MGIKGIRRLTQGLALLTPAIGVALLQAADLTCVPVRASGVEGVDWEIGPGPNEITLAHGGQSVEVQVFISAFAPQAVRSYQASVACASLQSSIQGEAVEIQMPCFDGFGVDFCIGVDEAEPTYILADADPTFTACDPHNCSGGVDGITCGAISLKGDSGPDDGGNHYAMTFGFDITADMKGTIELSLTALPPYTLLSTLEGVEIPVGTISPALITVPDTGRPNADPELGLGAEALVQECFSVDDCGFFGVSPNVDCIPAPDGTFPGTCYASGSRYLAITPNSANAGTLTARRITLDINGNAMYDAGVDHILGWMGEPFSTIVTGPEPSPQAQARISATPAYRDWNDLTDVDPLLTGAVAVHLGDCEIAPKGGDPETVGNVYFIQAIHQLDDVADEVRYSAPLRLRTAVRSGDVGGTGLGGDYPNQTTNITDAFKVVLGFQGVQTIPKWRLEQTGGQIADNVPDLGAINLGDVFESVMGFQSGGAYRFDQPCDCPGQNCP